MPKARRRLGMLEPQGSFVSVSGVSQHDVMKMI